MKKGERFLKLDLQFIKNNYINGISATRIAEHCDTTTHTIINRLKEMGIYEGHREGKLFNPNLKEDYFHKIDHQNKAYFLGLLLTDGNIYDDGISPMLRIELQERDEYILRTLKEELQCNNKIQHYCRVRQSGYESKTATFCIKNKTLVKDLAQYSMVPNKTLTAIMPKLSKKMMPHFIRGAIDGDGWIINKDKKYEIGLCGCSPMVPQIMQFLTKELDLSKPHIHICKGGKHIHPMYNITFTGKSNFEKIINYIYKDANYFLKRKYDRATSC